MLFKARWVRIVFVLLTVATQYVAAAEEQKILPKSLKVSAAAEVRSTYISLGKLLEDRPMQVLSLRAAYETENFGSFGVRNWDVSSLTGRRSDAHRHAFYHTEVGPYWAYDWQLAEALKLKTEFTLSWTFYGGFENESSNKSYRWYQIDQSLENPILTPFLRLRRCVEGSSYVYYKTGVRHRFDLGESFYCTPSVFIEGGNRRNFNRVFGENIKGDDWDTFGVSSISFRLELGWKICSWATAFAFVEQYEVVGGDARDTNAASTYRCAHNDWTYAGLGLRLRF